MVARIWEFFGYRASDESDEARDAARTADCPFLEGKCEKRLSDGVISGVCTIKPVTTGPVICCPIRLYAEDYRILKDVSERAFSSGLPLIPGRNAINEALRTKAPAVAVFGKKWGGELRLPQRNGSGGYFVDWILALIDQDGRMVEFVAIEVQTIDTTGNYRDGRIALLSPGRETVKTQAGLNWENVSKRILPQLIYKGQVLQREALCKKGLFFVCPLPVYTRMMERLGGSEGLIRYELQPASITFLAYDFAPDQGYVEPGSTLPIALEEAHTTTIYKLQERFNNVELPRENAYRDAILDALAP